MYAKIDNAEFPVQLSGFAGSLRESFFKVMRRASGEMEDSLKSSLSITGEVINGKRSSSEPYSMPYKISGNLVKAIRVRYKQSKDSAVIEAGIDTSRAAYGLYLEYGTTRMKPRPFLLPNAIICFNKIRSELRKIEEDL